MAVVSALTTAWFADNVKRGTAVFVAVGFVDVTFMSPFANVPKVTVTPGTFTTKQFAVINKTVNGFRITSNGAVTLGVDWIAVSP